MLRKLIPLRFCTFPGWARDAHSETILCILIEFRPPIVATKLRRFDHWSNVTYPLMVEGRLRILNFGINALQRRTFSFCPCRAVLKSVEIRFLFFASLIRRLRPNCSRLRRDSLAKHG